MPNWHRHLTQSEGEELQTALGQITAARKIVDTLRNRAKVRGYRKERT